MTSDIAIKKKFNSLLKESIKNMCDKKVNKVAYGLFIDFANDYGISEIYLKKQLLNLQDLGQLTIEEDADKRVYVYIENQYIINDLKKSLFVTNKKKEVKASEFSF